MTFDGPLIYFLIALWVCPVVEYFVLARRIPPTPSDRELRTATRAWRFARVVSPILVAWAVIGTSYYARVTPEYASMLRVGITQWLSFKMWKSYLGRALSPGGRS